MLLVVNFVKSAIAANTAIAGLNGPTSGVTPASAHPAIPVTAPAANLNKPAVVNPVPVIPVAPIVSTPANVVNAPVVTQQPVPVQPPVTPPVVVPPVTPIPAPTQVPVVSAPGGSTNSKSSITVLEEQNDGKEAHSSTGYSSEEISGEVTESPLNTVDLMTSGNWLLKRAWWEKTEDLYEQLKDVVSKIMERRSYFLSQRNEIDRALDICFSEVGLEQGELYDIVGYGKDLLDKEKAQGLVIPEEKILVEKLAGKERELEQLKLDTKGIDDISKKIDDALELFFGQIDTCNKYEHKAWENFKDIARELDDKEARKLYYNTEALLKDVKNIQKYLEVEFTKYFNDMLQAAKDHTQKISSQVNMLKTAGIDLKKELKILEQKTSGPAREKDAERKAAEDKKKAEEAEEKRQEALEKAKWYYPLKSFYMSASQKCVVLLGHLGFVTSYVTKANNLVYAGFQKIKAITFKVLGKSPAPAPAEVKKDKKIDANEKKNDASVDLKKAEKTKPIIHEKDDKMDDQLSDAAKLSEIKTEKQQPEQAKKVEPVAKSIEQSKQNNHSVKYYEKTGEQTDMNADVDYYNLEDTEALN